MNQSMSLFGSGCIDSLPVYILNLQTFDLFQQKTFAHALIRSVTLRGISNGNMVTFDVDMII
jgi:hypothetical protein